MTKHSRDGIASYLGSLPTWQDAGGRAALLRDLLWQVGRRGSGVGLSAEAAARVAAEHLADPAGLAVLARTLADLGIEPPPWCVSGDASKALPGAAPWTGDPYPGMRPFRTDEAPIFCGRGLETRALLRGLARPAPCLALVTGARGCGKTSLVQAGVVGALAAGNLPGLPGGEHWVVTGMRPAATDGDPFAALAAALPDQMTDAPSGAELSGDPGALPALAGRMLQGRPADACWLLVVDALDDLWVPDCAPHRDLFLERLCALADIERVRVIATLDATHVAGCVEHAGLRARLNAGALYALAAPAPATMRRMILGPLAALAPERRVAVDLEGASRLAEVAAAAGPAGLLYLADCLDTAWRLRGQRPLLAPDPISPASPEPDAVAEPPAHDPRQIVADAFAERAGAALTAAGDPHGSALPPIFAAVAASDAARAGAGLGVPLATWSEDGPERRVVAALAAPACGLLRIEPADSDGAGGAGGAARVRLAHGGLAQAWPALADWIDERRAAERLAGRIQREARAWAGRGCPDGERWPHEQLEPARHCLTVTGLLASLERDVTLADFLTPEAERLLAEVLCQRTPDGRREDIGLRLAAIGDPRPGVLPVDGAPRPSWCALPAGTVLIDGSREVAVAPFRIAAYPVTQAQFAAFLDAADGFGDDRWWRGLQRRPYPECGGARRDNYPATLVSWHDASAFCRWLSGRLGYEVRLPTEAEWQWAAQSARPEFVYPWGGDWLPRHANTDEAGIGRTAAVGMYPAGQSVQGVSDLAGNTWEWCSSGFDPAAEPRGERGAARVIRGGSWRVNRGFARADFRLDAMPEDRVGSTGFRLVTGDPGGR